jgi:phosphoribosylformylglycinamidine synthase PurS subunit
MGRFKRVVAVDLRPALLDPEGEAIMGVLSSLGYGVEEVRVGRRIQLTVSADSDAEADRVCAEMASRVLANPVMETFRVTGVDPADAP